MSETVELRFDGVHNHKHPIRVLEELAMDEWRKGIRRSYVPGTNYYPPPQYPSIITVDKIISALNGMNDRLKLLEESMGGLGQRLDKIIAKITEYDSKLEELESRVLCYECAE